MSIEADARQEAERRWPLNHLVDDPFGETGEAWSDPYGYHETAQKAFEAGAVWASERADREPSDTEVEAERHGIPLEAETNAAGEAIWGRGYRLPKEVIRAALLAAQEVRRDVV